MSNNHSLWFPYAQMKLMNTPLEISSAQGVYLIDKDNNRYVDAISSWWAVIHGYSHPNLVNVIKTQAETLSHVMLGGITHKPAQQCADLLVDITPEGLSHVFFSDSGSVGMEVAMKMAIQFWKNQGNHEKIKFVSLKKAYHGDTTGVMSICDPEEGMHRLFKGFLQEHFIVEPPKGDGEQSLESVKSLFEANHQKIAAIVLEPLLQAAGGFNMYSPKYLNELRKLCDQFNVLLVFDEVATGFGRTGSLFATDQCDVIPDILTLGKGLTGGMLGLAATITTTKLFNAFYSDNKMDCFMHGPTFMGNPLACSVAIESIKLAQKPDFLPKIKLIEQILKEELLSFTNSNVISTRVLGATGVIEVASIDCLNGFQHFALEQGVWARTFGNYLYTMPPYIINEDQLRLVCHVMKQWFNH